MPALAAAYATGERGWGLRAAAVEMVMMLPHDRRVKLIVLTTKGEKMKAELLREFHTPPAHLLPLGERHLELLERLLKKLPPTPGS
jgi:hypothetical protein